MLRAEPYVHKMAVQYWFIDCEARGMAGSAWSFEETRALLNLWEDDRVQRQLEGCWKLFSTVGLCPHTQQVSSDGRAVDRDDIPPPPHSSHQRSEHAFDSASSVPYKMADGSGYENNVPVLYLTTLQNGFC